MLSIIIVSYNTRELLRRCLSSLCNHVAGAEVIVVDNASRDGSAAMVVSEFPSAKLVALEKNLGFAGGNNVGYRHATGDFILLLNSDTYVEDDSLERCAAWMEAHPEVGAASPRLIGFDGVPQPCAHPFPSFWRKFRQTFHLSLPAESKGAPGWLIGAALMLRRDAVEQLGLLLDTSYFMYWEDTDLSSRLLRGGWKLAAYLEGHVRHLGGGSSNAGDGAVRPELQACFLKGKYQWFGRYRPRWERAGLWALDGVDVLRNFLRGVLYPRRRRECRQARALARALWQLLLQKTPIVRRWC